LRHLLADARKPSEVDGILTDPQLLTDELAWTVRKRAGSDVGLALHAIAGPDNKIQNLASGETYIALTDGKNFMRRSATTAGRGQYDRTRMTLNAIDLLRTALLDGVK
jgi:nicotinamide mononucleotide (NMN) deamidase PncC